MSRIIEHANLLLLCVFAASACETVTSPRSGDVWFWGTDQHIKWTPFSSLGQVFQICNHFFDRTRVVSGCCCTLEKRFVVSANCIEHCRSRFLRLARAQFHPKRLLQYCAYDNYWPLIVAHSLLMCSDF